MENKQRQMLEPGLYFDHAYRTPEELALAVIELALNFGWQDAEAAHLVQYHYDPHVGHNCTGNGWYCTIRASYGHLDADMSQALSDFAFDATGSAQEYLNDHCVPEGYYAGNDGDAGAFGVWEIGDE